MTLEHETSAQEDRQTASAFLPPAQNADGQTDSRWLKKCLRRLPLGLIVFVVTFLFFCPHMCNRGLKWLEALAFFLGSPICTALIFGSAQVRTGCAAVLTIMLFWGAYLVIVHL